MELYEQRNIVERALNERMIRHVSAILRPWAKEVGVDLYEDRLQSLERNYQSTFEYFLAQDDGDREDILNRLTHDAFCLADELYADVRLKRGLAPEMHGYNPDNPDSVMRYFSSCVHLQEEDLEWMTEVVNDKERTGLALLVLASVGKNLRENFREAVMKTMIEAMDAPSELVRNQAIMSVVMLFAQWDARLDFFPELNEAFELHLDPEAAFTTLRAIVHTSAADFKTLMKEEVQQMDEVPDELKQLMEEMNRPSEDDKVAEQLEQMSESMPESESEYFRTIATILPQTWVYDCIVGEDEDHNREMALLYLSTGNMDLMWDHLDEAEDWLVERLRSSEATPVDYINYGHCCFINGDRSLAYENYREARVQINSAKQFMALFRPDRKMLMEKGVPLDDIYLMEDQLVKVNG